MDVHTSKRMIWFEQFADLILRMNRTPIGRRLSLCFAMIVLSMLVGDAYILWELHTARADALRLNGIHEAVTAVFGVHESLVEFHDRLEAIALSKNSVQVNKEAAVLAGAVHEQVERARISLRQTPPGFWRDPTVLPALEDIDETLPEQLKDLQMLANSGDWTAVERRLQAQIRWLESVTTDMVKKVDDSAAREEQRSVEDARRAEARAFLVVPVISLLTVLIAAGLGVAITRSITRPLDRVTHAAHALAGGDFTYRIQGDGEDELAELARVFNQTSFQLQELYCRLERSEDRLRRLINAVPSVVWSAEPGGQIDFVSERWSELTGKSVEGALGWNWASAIHPDDLKHFTVVWRQSLATGKSSRTEARVRMANGEYHWWMVSNIPVRDEQGRIVKWYGSSTDVDERKRAEEERERMRNELAHVNRVSLLGELGASLSHELKQPIAAAVISAQTARRWLKRDEPNVPSALEAVTRVIESGSRAAALIDGIRSLYKKAPQKRQSLDVNQVIAEIVELLRAEASRSKVSIQTDLASGLPPIDADRVQLQQVLMNLMLNGAEAMREQAGVLTVASRLEGENALVISVGDTGPGLPAGAGEEIFKAFYTTKPQGSGMGLAISRSIVEAHGGRLWATNNAEGGATFHFTLPIAVRAAQAAQCQS